MDTLIRELHHVYYNEVVCKGKKYQRFVEDYVSSHLGIPLNATLDGIKAFNQELSMRNKLCSLLTEREDIVEEYMSAKDISKEDITTFLSRFDNEAYDRSLHQVAVYSCLHEAVWDALAEILNSLQLLEEEITPEALKSLSITGKAQSCYRINHNSHGAYIAYFFYLLSNYQLIPKEWKSIICRYNRLLRTSGKPMTANDLGTPLARMNIYKMAKRPYVDIEQAVKKAINAC